MKRKGSFYNPDKPEGLESEIDGSVGFGNKKDQEKEIEIKVMATAAELETDRVSEKR